MNLFTTRMKLGVFDKKEENPFDAIPYTAVDTKEAREFNCEVAEKSAVLLKNKVIIFFHWIKGRLRPSG